MFSESNLRPLGSSLLPLQPPPGAFARRTRHRPSRHTDPPWDRPSAQVFSPIISWVACCWNATFYSILIHSFLLPSNVFQIPLCNIFLFYRINGCLHVIPFCCPFRKEISKSFATCLGIQKSVFFPQKLLDLVKHNPAVTNIFSTDFFFLGCFHIVLDIDIAFLVLKVLRWHVYLRTENNPPLICQMLRPLSIKNLSVSSKPTCMRSSCFPPFSFFSHDFQSFS